MGLESAARQAAHRCAAVRAFLLGAGSVITLSLFAVALAGTGLLTTVGVIVAMDTFGPVSDNAQGIAEMSGDAEGEGAQVLTSLDAASATPRRRSLGGHRDRDGGALPRRVVRFVRRRGPAGDQQAGDALQGLSVQDATQYLGIPDVSNPRNLVGLLIGARSCSCSRVWPSTP